MKNVLTDFKKVKKGLWAAAAAGTMLFAGTTFAGTPSALAANFSGTGSSVTLAFYSPLSIVTDLPGSAEYCQNGTLTLSAEFSGEISSYKWFFRASGESAFQEIEGQNLPAVTLGSDGAPAPMDGEYKVVAYAADSESELSSGICKAKMASAITTPVISLRSGSEVSDLTFCVDNELRVVASASGTVKMYRWQKLINGAFYNLDINDYPTSNTAELRINKLKLTDAGVYRVMAYGSSICDESGVPSGTLQIAVNPGFIFTQQPQTVIQCHRQRVELPVSGIGTINSYQWYKDGLPIDPEKNATAQNPLFVIDSAEYEDAGSYYCILTVNDCLGAREVKTDIAGIYIISSTNIVSQPGEVFVENGGIASFSIKAHTRGIEPPFYQHDYQWYRFKSGKRTKMVNDARISGAHSPNMTIKNVALSDFTDNTDVNDYYYCVVTGQCGSDTSKAGKLLPAGGIKITSQPQDLEVCVGQTAAYNISANLTGEGEKLVYQWLFNGNKLVESKNITGTNTDVLTIQEVPANMSGVISCEVTVLPGKVVRLSSQAKLSVKTAPVVDNNFVENYTVTTGDKLTISSMNTTPEGASYKWKKDGAVIDGATNADYVVDAATVENAGKYVCVITNECGETTTPEITVVVRPVNILGITDGTSSDKIQVAPNPSNGASVVSFYSERQANVKLTVCDAMGREVALLFNGMTSTGINRITISADSLGMANGVYYLNLVSEGVNATKMIVVAR